MLSNLEMIALKNLKESESQRIVVEGDSATVDDKSIPLRLVGVFSRLMLIDSLGRENGIDTYELNRTGRQVVGNPELANQILTATGSGYGASNYF